MKGFEFSLEDHSTLVLEKRGKFTYSLHLNAFNLGHTTLETSCRRSRNMLVLYYTKGKNNSSWRHKRAESRWLSSNESEIERSLAVQ